MPEISEFELNEYKTCKPDIDYIKISLKTGDNLDKLLIRIYEGVNSNPKKNQSPINMVAKIKTTECLKKLNQVFAFPKYMSLILLGSDSVGKTNFMNRYFRNIYSETEL